MRLLVLLATGLVTGIAAGDDAKKSSFGPFEPLPEETLFHALKAAGYGEVKEGENGRVNIKMGNLVLYFRALMIDPKSEDWQIGYIDSKGKVVRVKLSSGRAVRDAHALVMAEGVRDKLDKSCLEIFDKALRAAPGRADLADTPTADLVDSLVAHQEVSAEVKKRVVAEYKLVTEKEIPDRATFREQVIDQLMVAEAESFMYSAVVIRDVDKHLKRDYSDDSATDRAKRLLGAYLPRPREYVIRDLFSLPKVESDAILSLLAYDPACESYPVIRETKDGTQATFELPGSHLRYSYAIAQAAKQEDNMDKDQRRRFDDAVKEHPAYFLLSKISDEDLVDTLPLAEADRKEMMRGIRYYRVFRDEKKSKEIRADLVQMALIVAARKDRVAGELARKLAKEAEKDKSKDK